MTTCPPASSSTTLMHSGQWLLTCRCSWCVFELRKGWRDVYEGLGAFIGAHYNYDDDVRWQSVRTCYVLFRTLFYKLHTFRNRKNAPASSLRSFRHFPFSPSTGKCAFYFRCCFYIASMFVSCNETGVCQFGGIAAPA